VKTFFKWFIPNALFALCWYLGAVENMSGFLFFGKAWTWLALSRAIVFVPVPKKQLREIFKNSFSNLNLFNKTLDISYDIAICLLLLSFDFGGYAFLYALSNLLLYGIIQSSLEKD
jgi:hypothetical protein